MPSFGTTSRARLETCDFRLQQVMQRVVERYDITILCGHRTQQEQDEAVANGRSQTPWPNSKHNQSPSKAVDIAPWPIPKDWDPRPFIFVAGMVMMAAADLGYRIRWGGDWDMDGDLLDNKFNDYVHFEVD